MVMLLGLSSARLAEVARLGSYGAVFAAAAKPETKALGEAGNDLVFKPFVPCRYIDTRGPGGKISGVRTFDLANAGPVYGGNAGCDPKTLAGVANEDAIGALAVNIALVDTSGGAPPGFLTMRPAGSTELTALGNWFIASPSAQDSNAAVVAIDQTAQAPEVEIYTSGPVHVIVDLLGERDRARLRRRIDRKRCNGRPPASAVSDQKRQLPHRLHDRGRRLRLLHDHQPWAGGDGQQGRVASQLPWLRCCDPDLSQFLDLPLDQQRPGGDLARADARELLPRTGALTQDGGRR